MAQSNETSIRLTATADIAQINEMANAVNNLTDAVRRYNQEAGQSGGQPVGAAPVPGAAMAPPVAGQPPAPPPKPFAPQPRPAAPPRPGYSMTPVDEYEDFVNDPTRPPPNGAPPRNNSRGGPTLQQFGNAGNGSAEALATLMGGATLGGLAGLAVGKMQAESQQPFLERWGRRAGRFAGLLAGPFGSKLGGMVGGAVGSGATSIMNAGLQAGNMGLGLALGQSPSGFMLSSASKYMELSKTIAQVNARFRETDGYVAGFGASMGYGIQMSSALAKTLGDATNSVREEQFKRYAGFSKAFGMDPNSGMAALGQLEFSQGRELGRADLARLYTGAKGLGMEQGQMEQFARTLAGMSEQYLRQSGAGLEAGDAASMLSIARDVFQPGWRDDPSMGLDPRARAGNALDFTNRLNSMLSSKSGAAGTTMMRAMGFGKGDMSYMDMRIRQSQGLQNLDNLEDLMHYMNVRAPKDGNRRMGYQFRFMESFAQEAGVDMNPMEIIGLIGALGTDEKLAKFRAARRDGGDEAAMEVFKSGLSPKERALFEEGGFAALGGSKTSLGESVEMRIERMMMTVGKPIAEAIPPLQNAVMSITKAMDNLVDIDAGDLLNRLVKGVETTAAEIEKWSKDGGSIPTPLGPIKSDDARDIINDPLGAGWNALGLPTLEVKGMDGNMFPVIGDTAGGGRN